MSFLHIAILSSQFFSTYSLLLDSLKITSLCSWVHHLCLTSQLCSVHISQCSPNRCIISYPSTQQVHQKVTSVPHISVRAPRLKFLVTLYALWLSAFLSFFKMSSPGFNFPPSPESRPATPLRSLFSCLAYLPDTGFCSYLCYLELVQSDS